MHFAGLHTITAVFDKITYTKYNSLWICVCTQHINSNRPVPEESTVIKGIKIIFKVMSAGLLAIAILSLILIPYSLYPLHIPNPNGNTDYVWQPDSLCMTMTEGVGYSKYDAQGYNNAAVIDNPDVIILGSSHMEASNVLPHECVGGRLSQMLAGHFTVYNMGISGHHFYKVCKYLPANLALYDTPPKIVVIETSTVTLTQDEVRAALNGDVDFTPSHNTGLIATLQRVPFFRLLYKQLTGGLLDLFMPPRTTADASTPAAPAGEPVADLQAYEELFSHMAALEAQYGSQIVIFYHPTAQLQPDGSVAYDGEVYRTAFAEAATRHGIDFIDLTEPFRALYTTEHKLPHGFFTGKVGAGHMNAEGHRVAAEEICQLILTMEKEGTICK